MDRQSEPNKRKMKTKERRNEDPFDFSMPHIFWLSKMLRVIHEQSEKTKAEKCSSEHGEYHV